MSVWVWLVRSKKKEKKNLCAQRMVFFLPTAYVAEGIQLGCFHRHPSSYETRRDRAVRASTLVGIAHYILLRSTWRWQ